jgi:RNA polymerase sigma-70 factor, ECF subfamily
VADTEGFEEFYTATVGRLLGQLYTVTGDLHEAEEVVQEAFARASTRWGGCGTTTSPRPGSAGWP